MEYEFLFLDYETFSLADLSEVGLDNYAKDPSTGISVLGWALDREPIEQWYPHVARPPKKLLTAMRNPKILKIAWNAQFEFEITRRVMGPRYMGEAFEVPISEFRDPMVLAHGLSLPGKLEKVAQLLKTKEQKDPRGDVLKHMFCKPVSKGGEETLFGISPPLFRDHISHPKEFAEYMKYNEQDVRAERDLWYRLIKIPFPDADWQCWILDQKINAFGMPGNRELAKKMYRLAERYILEQRKRVQELTGLKNPNSRDQMIEWAQARGYPWKSLLASFVQMELDNPNSPITPECRTALTIRATCTRSSHKKLEKFLLTLSNDDRLRYQFRYMGAPRTGRWAGGTEDGSSFQAQNMPRGMKAVKKFLERALELVRTEDYDGIIREFTNTKNPKDSVTVIELIITLLRSLFQAKPGKKLVVADLNAIENRMLGWAASCWNILEVFTHKPEDGGDPYLSFGCRLYNKTYAEMWAKYISGDVDDRQNSKPAVLGAGYGLGGGEMKKNDKGDMVRGGLWGYALNVCGVDMSKDLAHKAVDIFRTAYPEVVQFWTDLEEAFKQVLTRGGVIQVGPFTWDKKQRAWVKNPKFLGCVLTFSRMKMEGGGYTVCMKLPSGRSLHYLNATLDAEVKQSKKTGEPYTVQTIHYDGIEHSTSKDATGQDEKKTHKWGRVKTYGGKICENAIQAMARDILRDGILAADEMGFHIFGLFHDEPACEEDDDMFGLGVNDLIDCITRVPWWAPRLLLGADGFESYVYHK
jgi:DNA polymerase